MTTVKFYHSETDAPLGFSISGHADYDDYGSDIVCAAISSASLMAANTITEIIGMDAYAYADDDGELILKVPEEDADKSKDILLGLELHLKALAEQYPNNVTITTEV